MNHLGSAAQTLETRFVQQFSTKGSISLLVGLACNLAFIGQSYFWPAMWHTSVFKISYTDASYLGQLLCALALIFYFKKTNRITIHPRVILVSAAFVFIIMIAYYYFFEIGFDIPDPVNWLFGALFGIYLPLSLATWIVFFIGSKPARLMWNIMPSAIFASFVIWLFSGLEPLKVCICTAILIAVSTLIQIHRLNHYQAKPTPPALGNSNTEYSYSASATFLFSLAFVIAVSFAGINGDNASFATGAFFAPMLIICVLLLFVDQVGFPLSNIAVPAIVMATIATSSFHFDPALTFDIAALGMFLFLTFAVVLLCSSDFDDKQKQIHEFLLLMVAFAAGCLVGRVAVAACMAWISEYASEVLIFISISAAFTSMIVLIRKGATRRRTQQWFKPEESEDTEISAEDELAMKQAKIDDVAKKYNLGLREKEVLTLLLDGDSASEIAHKLVIANGTAKSHIRHVYKKLDVHDRNQLFNLVSSDSSEIQHVK